MLDLQNLALRTLNSRAGEPPRMPSMGLDWPHVYYPDNLDNIRVITHDGLVVSAVAIAPMTVRTPRGRIELGGINGFVTHPDHRRLGLGTAVLHDAHRVMRESGHHIAMLGTVSQNYYRRFGWEMGMRQRSHTLDRANITLLPPSPAPEINRGLALARDGAHVDARPRANGRRPRRALLHPGGPVSGRPAARRTARTASRWRTWPSVSGQVAGVRRRRGGHRGAAAARAARCIDDPRASTTDRPPGESTVVTLDVVVPESNDGIAGLLLETGIPFGQTHHYMIKVINLDSLLSALDLNEIEATPSGDGWRLRRGDRTLEVSECELVKLLFGPERFPDFAPDLFPLDFFQWVLDRM